jgi:mevalonate kinase
MASVVEVFKNLLLSSLIDISKWAQAIELAQSCFVDWNLVPAEAQQHINLLKSNGALACKMTGSGGGGYVLSLWPNEISLKKLSENIQHSLIEIKS